MCSTKSKTYVNAHLFSFIPIVHKLRCGCGDGGIETILRVKYIAPNLKHHRQNHARQCLRQTHLTVSSFSLFCIACESTLSLRVASPEHTNTLAHMSSTSAAIIYPFFSVPVPVAGGAADGVVLPAHIFANISFIPRAKSTLTAITRMFALILHIESHCVCVRVCHVLIKYK